MKMIRMRTNNIKINNNIKTIVIMTLIILVILIAMPLIFLGEEKENLDIFNLTDKNIIKNSQIIFPIDGKVKLYRKAEDKVEEVDLEQYVMGVVASEEPASFGEEALKAQAVAARTFYMNRRSNPNKDDKEKGAEICDHSAGCKPEHHDRSGSWQVFSGGDGIYIADLLRRGTLYGKMAGP